MNELQVYSGIAILFVTLIHSNGFFLSRVLHLTSYIGGGLGFYMWDKIVHIAVPMFIFISGYKYGMKDKNEEYSTLLSKKYNKVIKPFLFVSIFWILYKCGELLFLNKAVIDFHLFGVASRDFLRIFFGFNYAYQLWYIPMYVIVVFGYPIIVKYLKNPKTRLIILYMVAIIISVIQSKTKLLTNDYLNPVGYIYYFFLYELGSQMYSKGSELNKKYSKLIIVAYLILLPAESLIKNSFINNMCTTLLLTPLAVVAFYNIAILLKKNKILLTLGKYSLPIFLFHEPVFVRETSNFLLIHNLYSSKIMIPIVSIISIVLSIGFYEIIIRTNLGKYMFDMKRPKKVVRVTLTNE